MTALPIALRELRAAARKPSTYWLRAGAVFLFFIVAVWIFTVGHNERPSELAQISFAFLTGAAGVFCLVSGARYTADCISEEKRQGTLGLLFLTDLKGHDVVVGKLAASSLHAVHAVLGMIPILAIPLLLGGISGFQVARVGLAALNLLFFSLAVGLWASSMHHDAKRAASLTILVLLVFTLILPAMGGVLLANNRITQNALWPFLVPSPGFTFAAGFDPLFTKGRYWSSFVVVHFFAWLALGAACWITPRSWQDKPATATRLKWRERVQLLFSGNAKCRAARRRKMLDIGAYYWITGRHRARVLMIWAVLFVITGAWVVCFIKYKDDWLNEAVYVMTAILLNVILKGWAASEIGRQIAEDRQSGTMELLLSTPLSIKDIVHGQMQFTLRQFRTPLYFTTAVFGFFGIMTFTTVTAEHSIWVIFWIALTAMLYVDIWATFWVALADGLTYGNAHRASGVTFMRILVAPWIVIGGIIFLLVIGDVLSHGPEGGMAGFVLLWVLAGLVVDILFTMRARRMLFEDFRAIAAVPVAARTSLWKRLFG